MMRKLRIYMGLCLVNSLLFSTQVSVWAEEAQETVALEENLGQALEDENTQETDVIETSVGNENSEEQQEEMESIEEVESKEEDSETGQAQEPITESVVPEDTSTDGMENAWEYVDPLEYLDLEEYMGMDEETVREELSYLEDLVIYQYDSTGNYEEKDDGTVISMKIKQDLLYVTIFRYVEGNALENDAILLLNHFEVNQLRCANPPRVSGDTWDGYPVSYEYNWDNSGSCWDYGMWGGNGNLQGYTTPPGTYDSNVRHAMSMYCDGQNILLRIVFAAGYYDPANGDDYNFNFDGEGVKFRVTYQDGGNLTERRGEGTYPVMIIHSNDAISGQELLGYAGTITVNPDNVNDELILQIPVSECYRQNDRINADHFSKCDFFTPNLMYRSISCGGAGYNPVPFVTISLLGTTGLIYCGKRKRDEVKNESNI